MNHRRLIRRLLLTVAVVAIGATVIVFVGYRRSIRDPEVLLNQIQKQADMHLDKIRQTATKNGIREWHMVAESATLIKEKHTMHLIKPDVEFFMTDGDNVHLTADEGQIFTNSNRLSVSGNVSATTRQYQFHTDALKYNPAKRELLADQPVTLSGAAFTLKADRMAMNLDSRVTRFEGGVEGTISDDLQL